MNQKEIRDPRTYAIIGAAMEVHRAIGCGFLEAVYQEALGLELFERDIQFEQQVEISIYYKNQKLKTSYRPDFVCFGSVIVELKALVRISGSEEAQILNYLKASRNETGLLLNFGAPTLEFRRFVLSSKSASSVSSVDT